MSARSPDKTVPKARPKRRANSDEVLFLEQTVLAAICHYDPHSAGAALAIEGLRNYGWLQPEHATVFQAMRSVAARSHGSWRDILPAQATRMGFPDVDWARYFETETKTAPPMDELVARLTHATPAKR